jgi:type IV pilus assembly protein PilA
MLKRLRTNRAFTLVELMIVVAIVGLLAALAIYGVRKYMANAKSAEARNALGQMRKGALAAWDSEGMSGTNLEPGGTVPASRGLCADGPPVPTDVADVKGQKYQSSDADWAVGGWECLKFSLSGPQYYQYTYTSNGTEGFAAIAVGDLDGDEETSRFELNGVVASDGTLTVSPAIVETNAGE